MSQPQDFIGFAPDLTPVTPGVIVDCEMLLPAIKGFRAAPSLVASGAPALAAPCIGVAGFRKLNDTVRTVAGTTTNLYEKIAATWVDVSRGAAYIAGPDTERWRFAQYGDVSLATKKNTVIQQSLSGGFADIAGAPKAAIIETTNSFVMAFDYDDGTNNYVDGWASSALYNQADWTPAEATQAARGRLLDTAGRITAARRLGDQIVAYKERSMYVGRYVGPPIVWAWAHIPGTIGAPCNEAVVDIGTAHIFVGHEDFYLFDGTRPVAIGTPVREWFFKELNQSFAFKILGYHDRPRTSAYFYYPSIRSTDGTIDGCIVYNYKTNRWGRANRTIQAVFEYLSQGITYDELGTRFATYDSLPAIPYDSSYWLANTEVPAVVDATNTLVSLTGSAQSSSLTTGDYGDDQQYTLLRRVRPYFTSAPVSASMDDRRRDNAGAPFMIDSTVAMDQSRFDVLTSARWHSAKFQFVGDMEITGMSFDFVPEGSE